MNRQAMIQEKILAMCIPDKELVSRRYKELSKLSKKATLLKLGKKIRTDISPEKLYE